MSLEYDFGPVPKTDKELLEEALERERIMMLRVNDLEHELAKLRYRFRYELP